MELLGGYLNLAQQTEDLVRLLAAPDAKRSTRSSVPIRRAIRLSQDQITELVMGYQAGETVYSLATKYSINRNTVSTLLKRAGVPTRWRKLTDDQVHEAIALYSSGLSEADVSTQFDVYPSAIHAILKREGIPRRPNGTNQWSELSSL